MTNQEQSEKVVYGSLITSTKCYNCMHFPLCFAQKGGANLELASENDCCYYQSKLPKDSVVLSKEEHEILVKTAQGQISNMKATDFLKACISSGIMVEVVSTKEQVRQAVKEFAKELKAKTMCIQEYADGTRILETSNKLIDQSVKIFLANY